MTISGTPTAAGSFTSAYQVTDNDDSTASISYTIVIDPTLAFVTAVLPSGDVNTAYSQPVTVTGGTGSGTYTFNLSCVPTVLSGRNLPGVSRSMPPREPSSAAPASLQPERPPTF